MLKAIPREEKEAIPGIHTFNADQVMAGLAEADSIKTLQKSLNEAHTKIFNLQAAKENVEADLKKVTDSSKLLDLAKKENTTLLADNVRLKKEEAKASENFKSTLEAEQSRLIEENEQDCANRIRIPQHLTISANSAIRALSEAVYGDSDPNLRFEKRLIVELIPKVVHLIKETIKESSIGGGEISAASSRVPTVCIRDQDSLTLKAAIESLLMEHSLTFSQVRGQGYDGASNMQGSINGLKTLILNECSQAYFVHCFAHQLQLTQVALAKKNSDCGWLFVDVLAPLLNFVGGSPKRKEFLREKQRQGVVEALSLGEIESGTGLNQERGLCRPCDTRWGSHFKTILNVLDLYPSILLSLDSIAEVSDTLDSNIAQLLHTC
ncbi:uncharacterized protein LOC110685662 [Chenopodium quinoa]|uniref:uncharacterized protein LOC110685662 n=1 Tax=Chenopodium quinoa TaxID=63459 RepID=UPI000B792A86|nr:uncharacterized protein LOC110685662 [Chenopodium quinoa]